MKKQRPLLKLTDIDPRELSLVDLAANKHRYLIAKRRDPMEDEEQTQAVEDQTKGDEAKGPLPAPVEPPPIAETAATPADSDKRLQTTIDALNAAIDAMRHRPVAANDDGNVALQKRLTRLEKQFGLPTSSGPETTASQQTHVWPFDINRASEEL